VIARCTGFAQGFPGVDTLVAAAPLGGRQVSAAAPATVSPIHEPPQVHTPLPAKSSPDHDTGGFIEDFFLSFLSFSPKPNGYFSPTTLVSNERARFTIFNQAGWCRPLRQFKARRRLPVSFRAGNQNLHLYHCGRLEKARRSRSSPTIRAAICSNS